MKTIFKNGTYERVSEEVAESQVKHFGWVYKPKSEWKTSQLPGVDVSQVKPSDPQMVSEAGVKPKKYQKPKKS